MSKTGSTLHTRFFSRFALIALLGAATSMSGCDDSKAKTAAKSDDGKKSADKADKADESDKADDGAAEAAPAAEPKAKEGIAVHCDQIAELGMCTETPFSSPTYQALGEETVMERCKTGKAAKGECPKDARVGTCTASNGEVVQYFSNGGQAKTPEQAEAHCKDMFSGTFAKA